MYLPQDLTMLYSQHGVGDPVTSDESQPTVVGL